MFHIMRIPGDASYANVVGSRRRGLGLRGGGMEGWIEERGRTWMWARWVWYFHVEDGVGLG